MRYLARIQYDGSKFEGFQRLNNGCGVQNVLECVLSQIENTNVTVKGAGRTDRGVHAYDQCIHFDLERNISLEKLKYSMNRMLPNSVSVTSVSVVDNNFHARYSVKEKTYVYKVYVGEKNPFVVSYAFSFPYKLDVAIMKEVSQFFLGVHDFRNFVSGERKDYQSRIDSFRVFLEEDFLIFEVKGKSFYRYMVRSLVGALLDVGCGRVKKTAILSAIDYPKYEQRFFVAPTEGLYLMKIEY